MKLLKPSVIMGLPREPTEMERRLSGVLNKSPQMIRFYAARMAVETLKGGHLTQKESQLLGVKVWQSFNQISIVKLKFKSPWWRELADSKK